IDLVAATDTQGATTEEEEGDIGTEGSSNLHQSWGRNGAANEAQITEQCGSGIAGTAAEAAAGRNRFAEMDFDAGANAEFPLQCVRRGIDQILADRLEREGLVSLNGETNTGSPGGAQPQLIVQGNGLKDSAELVIGV